MSNEKIQCKDLRAGMCMFRLQYEALTEMLRKERDDLELLRSVFGINDETIFNR